MHFLKITTANISCLHFHLCKSPEKTLPTDRCSLKLCKVIFFDYVCGSGIALPFECELCGDRTFHPITRIQINFHIRYVCYCKNSDEKSGKYPIKLAINSKRSNIGVNGNSLLWKRAIIPNKVQGALNWVVSGQKCKLSFCLGVSEKTHSICTKHDLWPWIWCKTHAILVPKQIVSKRLNHSNSSHLLQIR